MSSQFSFPIIADPDRELAVKFGMIDPDEKDSRGMPLTARAVMLIGPDRKLKMSLLYPATTGRDFDEILRAIDSIQLTEKFPVATPANWQQGQDCMIQPSISNEDAQKTFMKGFNIVKVPSGKQYIRITPQPTSTPKEDAETRLSTPYSTVTSSTSPAKVNEPVKAKEKIDSEMEKTGGFLDKMFHNGYFHLLNSFFEGSIGFLHVAFPDLIYKGTQGNDPRAPAVLLSKFFGCSIMALSIAGYYARKDPYSPAGKGVVRALAFYHIMASLFALTLGVSIDGIKNRPQDFTHASIHAIIALGFWYFVFFGRKQKQKEKKE